MIGYRRTKFDVMHPLDTVMQKLLRMNEEKFVEKDVPDIRAVIERFQPPAATLMHLLTENPARYYKAPLGRDHQREAVERNTSRFLGSFISDCSYEELVRRAVDRNYEAVGRIDSPNRTATEIEDLPDFDIADRIRLVKTDEIAK